MTEIWSLPLNSCASFKEREFTHMHYSVTACNDFKGDGFTLRQVHYDPPRCTELQRYDHGQQG